jgi:hypothetical protein
MTKAQIWNRRCHANHLRLLHNDFTLQQVSIYSLRRKALNCKKFFRDQTWIDLLYNKCAEEEYYKWSLAYITKEHNFDVGDNVLSYVKTPHYTGKYKFIVLKSEASRRPVRFEFDDMNLKWCKSYAKGKVCLVIPSFNEWLDGKHFELFKPMVSTILCNDLLNHIGTFLC